MKKYAVFASIGFEFIGIIIAAYFLGQYLDTRFSGAGLYSAATILLGLVGWIVHILFLVKGLNSPDKNNKEG